MHGNKGIAGNPLNPLKGRPSIKLNGDWLDEIGFTYGKLVTAEYEKGKILLQLQDSDNYKDLVKAP